MIQFSSLWAGTSDWKNNIVFLGSKPQARYKAKMFFLFSINSLGSIYVVRAWRSATNFLS